MKNLLFIMLAAATLTACSKNNDDQPVNPVDGSEKVKKAVYESGPEFDSYVYDGAGRLKTRTSETGAKTEYEYQPGKVIQTLYNSDGSLNRVYTYGLDANGLAATETRSLQPDFLETRVYNSDNQILKSTWNIGSNVNVSEHFYSNGNCDSVRYSSNGNWDMTNKMTYYTDRLNTLDNSNFGRHFWGKGNKNLAKTGQYHYPDGSKGTLEEYAYEFDAKGRVLKKHSIEGGDTYTTTYDY
jgi:hypothetical protein